MGGDIPLLGIFCSLIYFWLRKKKQNDTEYVSYSTQNDRSGSMAELDLRGGTCSFSFVFYRSINTFPSVDRGSRASPRWVASVSDLWVISTTRFHLQLKSVGWGRLSRTTLNSRTESPHSSSVEVQLTRDDGNKSRRA